MQRSAGGYGVHMVCVCGVCGDVCAQLFELEEGRCEVGVWEGVYALEMGDVVDFGGVVMS